MPVIVSEAATAIQPTATETPTEPQPCRKRSDVMVIPPQINGLQK